MNLKPDEYGDDELIQAVERALRHWKWVESCYRDFNDEELSTIKALKEEYLLLLLEARKRNLSLTPKQLSKIILFPSPSRQA